MQFEPGAPKRMAREYIEALIVAVAVALILRTFVISAYKIPTASMVPTLKVGDFIFAYKLPFGVELPYSDHKKIGMTLPHRGDVVVFKYPGNESVSYIKRVVGLPGDKIAIRNKKLLVNDIEAQYRPEDPKIISDQPGHEFYKVFREILPGGSRTIMINQADETEFFGPAVVPPGYVFVLGDNRDSSDDSRYWGAVPASNIEGRAFFIWLSMDWFSGHLPRIRWERVFHRLH